MNRIFHLVHEHSAGIDTYINNLIQGARHQEKISIKRGTEKEIINAILKKISASDSILMHDPSFCRFLNMEFDNHLVLILHQDSPYYYAAVEEFGLLTDGIVCVSEDIRSKIGQRFQPKTITIGPSIKQRVLRNQNNDQSSPFTLIFVAREDLNKGVQHLPVIDRTLIENDIQPQWSIVLGSRPQEISSFRTWADDHNSRVTIQENIPNHTVPALISQHDALVLPSQTEGHPMVLIEALSQGVPPFSFYYSSHCTGHLPKDIDNIVGPSKDPEELTQRLIRHHQRSGKSLRSWQQAAQEFVARHHDPTLQAQKFGDFLDSLPRKRKSPLRQKFYKWKRRALILIKSW